MAIQAIEEVGVGGNFLGHDTTLAHFRTATWEPELFVHTTLRQWQERGNPDLAATARRIARERIAKQDYVLDADKRRDLDAIWRRAERE